MLQSIELSGHHTKLINIYCNTGYTELSVISRGLYATSGSLFFSCCLLLCHFSTTLGYITNLHCNIAISLQKPWVTDVPTLHQEKCCFKVKVTMVLHCKTFSPLRYFCSWFIKHAAWQFWCCTVQHEWCYQLDKCEQYRKINLSFRSVYCTIFCLCLFVYICTVPN